VVDLWKIVFLVKIAIFISELRHASANRVRFIEPHHECRAKSYFYLIVSFQKLVADFRLQARFLYSYWAWKLLSPSEPNEKISDFENFWGTASAMWCRRPPTLEIWAMQQKVRRACVWCEKEKNEIKNKKWARCAKKVVDLWKIVFLVKIAIFISELRHASAKRVRFIEPHHECRVKSYFYLIVSFQKSVADFRLQAIFEKTTFYILGQNARGRVSQMRKYLISRISEEPHQQSGAGDPRQ